MWQKGGGAWKRERERARDPDVVVVAECRCLVRADEHADVVDGRARQLRALG